MDEALLIGARRARFGAAALLLWDYAITFDEEVDYVGGGRWNFAKTLFIWNRYFGIFRALFDMAIFFNDHKSDEVGDFGFRWQYIAGTFSILTVEVILQIRLYAMYSRSKKLLVFMGTLCVIEIATVFALIGKSLVAMDVTPTGKVSCCTLPHAPFFGGYWGPILGYETLLFALAVFKGYQNRSRWSGMTQSPGNHLMDSLVKHSVIYYLVIFAVFLVNLIVPFVDARRVEYVVEFAMAFSSIMGNRVLLSIRSAYNKSEDSQHLPGDTIMSTHVTFNNDTAYPSDSQISGHATTFASEGSNLALPPPGLQSMAERVSAIPSNSISRQMLSHS